MLILKPVAENRLDTSDLGVHPEGLELLVQVPIINHKTRAIRKDYHIFFKP